MFDPLPYEKAFEEAADEQTSLLPIEMVASTIPHEYDAALLAFVLKELCLDNQLHLAEFLHVAFVVTTSNLDDMGPLLFKLKDNLFEQEISVQDFGDIMSRMQIVLNNSDLELIGHELGNCNSGSISFELFTELWRKFLFE